MNKADTPVAEKSRAALSSLFASSLLTLLKALVGFDTNSLGMLSEALHSGLDLLAALITLVAVRISAMPADGSHPYGHGKVEHLAALAETALLLLTCGWIIGEAVQRLLYKDAVIIPSIWAVAVIILSIVVDISRSRMLRRVARKHKSQALEADALHFTSDIWSSSVVLVGLGAIWLSQGLAPAHPLRPWLVHADALAALVVACIVLHACYTLAKKAVDSLMDRGHSEEGDIRQCLADVPGIARVERIRSRISGPDHFIELTIGVNADLGLDAAHHVANQAEDAIMRRLPGADVTVHVEPVAMEMRSRSDLTRVGDLALTNGLCARSVQCVSHPDGVHLELHVEAPPELTLALAHSRIDALEHALRREFPLASVVTRLEPARPLQDTGSDTTPILQEHFDWAEKLVSTAMARLPMLSDGHRLTPAREKTRGDLRFSLSLHCYLDGNLSVLQAHDAASELEEQMRRIAGARLGRVVIHIEPLP
ncbi:MAG: cation-efflux pump [Deltaproteobacteria bacterium]|jgi:cation diffusion facilitator family transporter|nr:cation-efflux pump [Deltaproteobacteria bacterium]